MDRRGFIVSAFSASAGAVSVAKLGFPAIVRAKGNELTITRVAIQNAAGRRLTPVAPNAYAPYRGYNAVESILRIQTAQGLEGICCAPDAKPALLKKLVGLDAFRLFKFGEKDRILSAADEHEPLLSKLSGCDVALTDLLAKALHRPATALLGESVRSSVQAYDSSVYMEDLLKPGERKGLAYMNGATPTNPVDLVARKAVWVTQERREGFKAIKMKIGRSKWMSSADEALARDIEVTNAVRKAIGWDVKLMVDGNRDYKGRPQMALKYARGVAESKIHWMEEMLPEEDSADILEFKRGLIASGSSAKLSAGESHEGGLPEDVLSRRVQVGGRDRPLVDIEQADMNAHGFLYLRAKAAREAKLGMTMAPHNFGSKLGFYAQVHLGMVAPNWELSEMDDSEFPAIVADGISIEKGMARVNGVAGLGIRLREENLSKPLIEFRK